ncbi:hypothetical protein D7X87_11310 [bacterium D16-54]|nr:hypothetical protein D7X87_11310 [bacterium D16-54]RKJ14347.1 hypothetical protein D7X65_11905 [bacterium D16-56]
MAGMEKACGFWMRLFGMKKKEREASHGREYNVVSCVFCEKRLYPKGYPLMHALSERRHLVP